MNPPGTEAASVRSHPPAAREAALDLARAVAMGLMVVGHCLHAVLTPEARSQGLTALYWETRAFTGPVFLVVSGWVLATVLRGPGAPARSGRKIASRLLLILLVGSALNWPWGAGSLLLAGDSERWAQLLAFGPLQCVATCGAIGLLVFWWIERRGARIAALAVLAAIPALASKAAVVVPACASLLPDGRSQYPLLPWSGFFFAGGVLALALPPGERGGRRRLLLGLSAGLILVSGYVDPLLLQPQASRGLLLRLGVASGVVLVAMLVPARIASRFVPLGKLSLWVYAIHLPLVYGIYTFGGLAGLVGQTLATEQALPIGLLVLVTSVALAVLGRRAARRWGWPLLQRAWRVVRPSETERSSLAA